MVILFWGGYSTRPSILLQKLNRTVSLCSRVLVEMGVFGAGVFRGWHKQC